MLFRSRTYGWLGDVNQVNDKLIRMLGVDSVLAQFRRRKIRKVRRHDRSCARMNCGGKNVPIVWVR